MQVLIVAGEASADIHAARLLACLREQIPHLQTFGIGGEEMRKSGAELLSDASQLSIVGINGWWGKLGALLSLQNRLVREARRRRPDAAILLDLPDFNLLLARRLKRLGIPVLYYISPQVWAWRSGRVKTIKKFVDRMFVLFRFEEDFYRDRGVDVRFVGHPLAEDIAPRQAFRSHADRLANPRIALLPGSRKKELEFHRAPLCETVHRLREQFPTAEFAIPIASTLDAKWVQSLFDGLNIHFELGNAREVLRWADAAIVASGTATLETALIGTPFCVLYRMSRLSYFVARHVVRYRRFFALPNVLLDSEVVPEWIQGAATEDHLAGTIVELIRREEVFERQRALLQKCREQLGGGGASRTAATEIARALEMGGHAC